MSEEIKDTIGIDNSELLREIYRDPELVAELHNRILKRRIHSQILALIAEALESGSIKAEDLKNTDTLLGLGIILSRS